MSTSVRLSEYCSDFFSPLTQPYPATQDSQHKDTCDHVTGYLGTIYGAWDFNRVFSYLLSYFKYVPLQEDRKEFLNHVRAQANIFGTALSIPKTLLDANNLRNSVRHLRQVRTNPPVHPERKKIIAHAFKKCTIDLMNFFNSIAQDLTFLHDVKIIKIGKCYPAADAAYNVTSIVPDTIELVDEVYKLRHYKTLSPHTESDKIMVKEKKTLSWLKIAKSAPSIVGAVIGLATIFFASLQMPIVAISMLSFNVAWLTFKLISNFYEKIVVDKHPARLMQRA